VDDDRSRRREEDPVRLGRGRQELWGSRAERADPQAAGGDERRDRPHDHGKAQWPHGNIVADGQDGIPPLRARI
jgi:hypothetical protein